jgi:transposase
MARDRQHHLSDGIGDAVHAIGNGSLEKKDAPHDYGSHKALRNRFIRWSRLGTFDRIFAALAGQRPEPERLPA